MSQKPRPAVQMWTDGSTSPNPGEGGWSAVLMLTGYPGRIIAGFERETTNNRMETEAVLRGLTALKYPCDVTLYTDSQYVVSGMRHLHDGSMLQTNQDLWYRIRPLVKIHRIKVVKVKGHSGRRFNDLADQYAELSRSNKRWIDEVFDVDAYVSRTTRSRAAAKYQ